MAEVRGLVAKAPVMVVAVEIGGLEWRLLLEVS